MRRIWTGGWFGDCGNAHAGGGEDNGEAAGVGGAMTDCGDAHASGGALTFSSAIIGSSWDIQAKVPPVKALSFTTLPPKFKSSLLRLFVIVLGFKFEGSRSIVI